MGIRDVMKEYRERHGQAPKSSPEANVSDVSVPIGGVFKHYPVNYPKIVHLIRSRNLNIKQAASGIGINPKNLALICKGAIMRPRLETVQKISHFFGLQPQDLYRDGNRSAD